MVIPSPQYKAYEDECSLYIPRQKQPIDFPVNIKCIFYMKTRRKVDLVNLEEAIADILVRYRVLSDDNCEVLVRWDGSEVRYDKAAARTEVTITACKASFLADTDQVRKQRRDTKFYTAHGKTQSLDDWANDLGVTVSTLRKRLAQGLPYEEVFVQDRRTRSDYKGSDKKRYFSELERRKKGNGTADHT